MLGPRDLRFFMEVSRTLNVTRASERLGMSQPAISHFLKRLEAELGASLFERSKTGLTLTPAGRRLQESARELLGEWDRLLGAVREDEGRLSGLYRIGCHPAVGSYTLPGLVTDLQERHPAIEFHFRHGLSRHVAEDVISHRLDLGIVVNPPAHPDLVIRELCTDEITLWSRKGRPKAMPLICDPELAQVQWILKEVGRSLKGAFTRRIESSSLEVIARLTDAGCGVGVLPARVVRALASDSVVRHPGSWPVFKDRVCLVYRAGLQRSRAAKAIIDSVIRTAPRA
jgi:DNA-binding transcriptional LysR family regulator